MAIDDVARQTEMQFQVSRLIGKGGFGSVYLANQQIAEGLYRPVAIKVLKRAISRDVDALHRLLDEGRILSKLHHPCIVRILQLAHIGEDLALITEFVPGSDLAAFLKAPNLLPERAVWQIGSDVCSALHCAWTTVSDESGAPLNLIHRDIKPQNIRLGPYGEVKVLDFGIARSTEMARMAHTQHGVLPGTVAYLPPEALLNSEVGDTTDVYALACTLFNLLTGERLNSADPVTAMGRAMDERDYREHIERRMNIVRNPDYAEALRRAVDFSPAQRPSHMEFLETCDALAFEAAGPSLRLWAARQERRLPPSQSGPLSGKLVRAWLVAQMGPALNEITAMNDDTLERPIPPPQDFIDPDEPEAVPTVIASPNMMSTLDRPPDNLFDPDSGLTPTPVAPLPVGSDLADLGSTPVAPEANPSERRPSPATPIMTPTRRQGYQSSRRPPAPSLPSAVSTGATPMPQHDRSKALSGVDVPALPEPTQLTDPKPASYDRMFLGVFALMSAGLFVVIVVLVLAAAQLAIF